jgi:hypothetical protein
MCCDGHQKMPFALVFPDRHSLKNSAQIFERAFLQTITKREATPWKT